MKHIPEAARRPVAIWFFILSFCIWFMVVIGGATRLTGSGLSITEWQPILGVIPPLNREAWEHAFDLYRQYPQYKLMNPDMDLAGFRVIYAWEYLHRLWGRLMGFALVIPMLVFWWKGWMDRTLIRRIVLLFFLGLAQGALGWFMVSSGLVDKPWVSPYRLTAHLLLALLLFSMTFWAALDVALPREGKTGPHDPVLRGLTWMTLGLLVLQICWGGFMAGTRAALSYPSFPKMNVQWIPDSFFQFDSLLRHLCEHPAAIHVLHRYLAVALVLAVLVLCAVGMSANPARRLKIGYYHLMGAVFFQFLLGVLTVIHSVGRIPVVLGVAHQGMAVLLLAALLYLAHQTLLPRKSL